MTRRSPRLGRLAALPVGLALVTAAAAAPMTANAAATPAAAADAPPSYTHNPGLPTGPSHWGALDPTWIACANTEGQSPVAVTTTVKAHLPALRVDYAPEPLVVENTGHYVEAPQPASGGGTLTVGSHTYTLQQWHVHAPAEHVIDGHQADLEIHLVNKDAQGNTAVLAVFADIVHGHAAAPQAPASDLLRTTLQAAPTGAGDEVDLGRDASAAVLLGTGFGGPGHARVVPNYLTYTGSLTTPPCTGGVQWFLLPKTIRIDQTSIQRLHALIAALPGYGGYPDDNRPIQPLAGRTVEQRVGG